MTTILILHVVLSLAGIASGLVAAAGLIAGKRTPRWTALFLTTTLATSLTGYLLPADRLLPSHIVGAISLVALAVAIVALYRMRLAGWWRPAYVVAAVLSLYLNLFVGVDQAFQKVPALAALAPTQSEPPFAVAQAVLFILFLVVARAGVVKARHNTVSG